VDAQEIYEVGILGVAFDITTEDSAGNSITQFDPPLRLQLNYGDLLSAEESETIQQKGIHLAYWNPILEMWTVVPSQVDYENQQIVAELDHLTIFAIMDGHPYYSFLPIIVE